MEPWLFLIIKKLHITIAISMMHISDVQQAPSTLWGRHEKRGNPETQQQALHATHLPTEAE